jgi:nitroreductase
VRKFKDKAVPKELIEDILECGRWAPSGLNHQPWRVIIVSNENAKKSLAKCTDCDDIVKSAPCIFAIYLDQTEEYNYTKNVQGIGAFFQNLLLAIHAKGLGGVWLGQIYNQKEQVDIVLGQTNSNWEFMGAIAFGFPAENGESDRMPLSDLIVNWL